MATPLKQDKQIIEEFGLTEVHELPADQKLAFLQAQRQELKSGIWRERVNVLHALRLQEDDNETLKNKGLSNITEHKNTIKQFKGAVDTIDTLIKEIEAEG